MAALYTSMVDCTIMVPIPKYSGENSMRCSNTQWICRLIVTDDNVKNKVFISYH